VRDGRHGPAGQQQAGSPLYREVGATGRLPYRSMDKSSRNDKAVRGDSEYTKDRESEL